MSIREQHALLPLPGASQQSHLADLEAVVASIQAQITDLERDYAPRDREFWGAGRDLLIDLRRVLQPFLQLVEEHHDSASSLAFPLQLLHLQLERTEAATSSYLTKCESYAKSRLQQRHDLLKRLRMIRDSITTVERLANNDGQGVHEEQVLPMPAPSLLRLAHQGPGSLADLDTTTALIREQIAELECDDGPHDGQFWQALIDQLLHLRQLIQPFFGLLEYSDATFPLIYSFIYPLYMLDAKIDTVGIAITVHLPRCQSKAKSRWKHHDDLLTRLRTLIETALQLIAAVTAVEKQLTESAQAKYPSLRIVSENDVQPEEEDQQ